MVAAPQIVGEQDSTPWFLADGGACGALLRAKNWDETSLGRPKGWPAPLKTLVGLMLASQQPMFVAWGAERTMLYNDGYAGLCQDRHPRALGSRFEDVWFDIIEDIGPIADKAYAGQSTHMGDIAFMVLRNGAPQEAHFAFSYTPIRLEDGAVGGMFCACVETTAQVLAERKLYLERERQRLALQQMPGFVAILNGPDHRYDYVNDAYIGIAGERDFLGRTVREVFPDIEGQGFLELLDRVYATGEPFRSTAMPISLARADGDRFIDFLYFPIRDDDGVVSGIFVGGYDVTDLVRANLHLETERDRYAAIVNGMGECFGLLAPDFTILEQNAEALRLDGRPRSEVIGKSHWQVYPGSDDMPIGKALKQAMRDRTPVALEHRFDWGEGRSLWIEMRAYPVPEGLAVFWKDVTERKVSDARLSESENRFRNMADHAPVMMWVTDSDGSCIYLNKSWYAFTGQTESEALGFGWLDAVHPDDRAEAERRYDEAVRSAQAFSLEYRLRRQDGAWRWVIDAASPRLNAGGEFLGFIGSVIDIDERKENENRIREHVEKLEAVLDAVPALIWVAEDVEAKHIRGNRQAADTLRIGSPQTNMSKSADDEAATAHFVVVDAAGKELQASDLPVQRAARGETVRDFEERVVFDDGVVIDLMGNAVPLRDTQGHPRGSVAAFIDITARKAAEAQLRRLNQDLEERVEAALAERDRMWAVTDDLFLTATTNGQFLDLSESWTRVLGWRREDMLSMRYDQLVKPDQIESLQERFYALQSGVASIAFENEVKTATGEYRTISWRLTGDPESDRIYGVGRDVSAERAQAAALADAERKLMDLQKLESIGQLTGGVAHDFNNLLSAILSNLEVARKRVGDQRASQLIDGAIKAAERGATLTTRLLAFARRQELKAEAISFPDLYADVKDMLDRSLGPMIQLRSAFPAHLPLVTADANQLELALLNLAINARDAMPNGGDLTVTAKTEEVLPGRSGDELAPGRYVVVSVADTGFGMDAATLQRATEPFFTTKGVGKGTGLGLSMVQGLVAQLGGALRLSSQLGSGTQVDLWLPEATTAAANPEPRGVAASAARISSLRILVVDDDPLVLMGTVAILEDLGHDVQQAHSGRQALHRLAEAHKVDLVLTDHAMPGMTGVELAKEIARLYPTLTVVLATGYAQLPQGDGSGLPRLSKPLSQDQVSALFATLNLNAGA